MTRINFRRARISDFLDIASLDRDAWKENNNCEYIPDGEHVWRIWVEYALVFCAVDDKEKVVGAILSFPSLNGMHCIHKVFVDRSMRGESIGSNLFDHLLNEIDQNEITCFLTVDPSNASAIRLYEKWGFLDKQFIKGFYRCDEDRYLLIRNARCA